MTELQGAGGISSSFGRITPGPAAPGVAAKTTAAPDGLAQGDAAVSPALRGRIIEIGAKAEEVQLTAGTANTALETLSEIEQTLVFALDAAREARDARSLPEAALGEMQKQVDLAINTVDGVAGGASFAGTKIFDGAAVLRVGSATLGLPRVSSQSLGSATGGDTVDYSRSIASAGAGGPNSLDSCAEGAVTAIEGGLAQIRGAKDAVSGFYSDAILPAVNNLDVMMSNALATGSRVDNLADAVALLSQAQGQAAGGASSGQSHAGESVVKLLD